MHSKLRYIAGCLCLLLSGWLQAEPLFDAHLHYNAADAAQYSPQQIIEILESHSIEHALITSTPPLQVMELHKLAPKRILPILGVYRTAMEKETWVDDPGLPSRIEAQLKQGGWRGIGELHLFANDRHSPVFRQIVELAQRYRLPLLLHADPAVIDTLYEQAPDHPVIWAHAGTFPYPDLIADYLQRYPALSVDLSVRDDRIAPDHQLSDDWYGLFLRYPDRFMVGVDTFSRSRWKRYGEVAEKIRRWTRQLPDDIARRLTCLNAAEMFHVRSAPPE